MRIAPIFAALIILMSVCGCIRSESAISGAAVSEIKPVQTEVAPASQQVYEIITTQADENQTPGYEDIALHDVLSGLDFHISDLYSYPVLIDTFAIWSAVSRQQHNEIKRLHDDIRDYFLSVSIDIDPNEDEGDVVAYAKEHGLSWFFSKDADGFLEALTQQYGIGITDVRKAPMILLCPDQNAHFLESRLRSAQELKEAIVTYCLGSRA